jgi:hypothetical protein
VWIDGVNRGTVDLYNASTLSRRVVFSQALANGPHTVEIRVLGARNAASSGNRIDVDAFIFVR